MTLVNIFWIKGENGLNRTKERKEESRNEKTTKGGQNLINGKERLFSESTSNFLI